MIIKGLILKREVFTKVSFAHLGIVEYIASCSFGDHMALANNVGMLADIQSFTDIMIGNQNPNTAVPKVANNLFDIGNRDRIDSSKGLVEQNKLWIRSQCAGNSSR